jgi:hypothetical protein
MHAAHGSQHVTRSRGERRVEHWMMSPLYRCTEPPARQASSITILVGPLILLVVPEDSFAI